LWYLFMSNSSTKKLNNESKLSFSVYYVQTKFKIDKWKIESWFHTLKLQTKLV